jgi:hypothetical protein
VGAIGDAATDAIAGLFEGKVAVVLRRYGIDDAGQGTFKRFYGQNIGMFNRH